MPREKMPLTTRAKIFLPFDALKGFREMLEETSRLKEPRKELAEDYLEELNLRFQELSLGKIIKIKYYDSKEECYKIKKGVLTKINLYHKRITICKEIIPLKDIIEIEVVEEAF